MPNSCSRVENASLHGLEAVPNIGQSPGHDYAHRVVEIGAPHLPLNGSRPYEPVVGLCGYHILLPCLAAPAHGAHGPRPGQRTRMAHRRCGYANGIIPLATGMRQADCGLFCGIYRLRIELSRALSTRDWNRRSKWGGSSPRRSGWNCTPMAQRSSTLSSASITPSSSP